jgi:threonine synthase
MHFYSTNDKQHRVTLQYAVTHGLAPDKGLYMPEKIPRLSDDFLGSIEKKSFREIAFAVSEKLLGEDIPGDELSRIIDHTIQFDAPLVGIEENVFALELFHGPTLAFKDFGARFMSQLLGYFSRLQHQEITILVATSGDTGSAVANGFLGVQGTKVIVLYPSGKVSEIQEKQFTTLGSNITAVEVEGTFDDCQQLVKQAFLDEEIKRDFFLTSANSINIARLIPQSFYYFYAFAGAKLLNKPVVISVPSGNFGNLTAGLLAKKMGLPVDHFIAATNVNDIVPTYLHTGVFSPRPSQETISNAMDVGNPSNFARMMELYENDVERLKMDISGWSFTDEQTRVAMKEVFNNHHYIMDPHGAIGYLGLKEYLRDHPDRIGIFLETAHPGKFFETVEKTLSQRIALPEALKSFLARKKESTRMANDFRSFKALIRNRGK